MGLPKFKKWLSVRAKGDKNFQGVFKNRVPDESDALVLDLNGMIHEGIQWAWGILKHKNSIQEAKMRKYSQVRRLDTMIKAILKILKKTINEVLPKTSLLIFIDGLAPCAKINQQRERRYKSVILSDGKSLDTSFITPGTDFMMALDVAMKAWLQDSRKMLPPHIFYSGFNVPGEGEHKIMSYLRMGKLKDKEVRFSGNIVLYGLDADLIMLSLISRQTNIFLMREDKRQIIDIEKLKFALIETSPEHLRGTALMDFVALIFNIGNDFLPHGPLHESMFNLIEGLLKAYRDVGKPLTLQTESGINDLDIKVLFEILESFGNLEAKLCANEASMPNYDAAPNMLINSGIVNVETPTFGNPSRYFDYSIFRSIWYNNEFMPAGQISKWGKLPIPSSEDIEDMCRRYTEGIAWSLRYYQTKSVNTMWFYPYNHPPLKLDLVRYLGFLSQDQHQDIKNAVKGNGEYLYNSIHQLLSVIHPDSAEISLPEPVRHLATDKNSPIFDQFPKSMIIEDYGVEPTFSYTYKGIMSPFDMERIIDVVKNIDLSAHTARFVMNKTGLTLNPIKKYTDTWNSFRGSLVHQQSFGPSIRERVYKKRIDIVPENNKKIIVEKGFPTIVAGGTTQNVVGNKTSKIAMSKIIRGTFSTQYQAHVNLTQEESKAMRKNKKSEKSENIVETKTSKGVDVGLQKEDSSRGFRGRGTSRGGRGSFRGRGTSSGARGSFRGRGTSRGNVL